MFEKALYISLCILFFSGLITSAQLKPEEGNDQIRLNQIGFYPDAPKIAVVLINKPGAFTIQSQSKKIVYKGLLRKSGQPDFAGKYTWIADFSTFNKPGTYVLNIPGLGTSYSFSIAKNVHQEVGHAVIKAFYFMRASTPLLEKYAGKWHRAMGHPGTVPTAGSGAVALARYSSML